MVTRAADARRGIVEELTATLSTVKNEATAKAALPKLAELKTRLSANTKTCRDAGVPSGAFHAMVKRQFRKDMTGLAAEFRRLFATQPPPPYVEILTPLKEMEPELRQNPFRRQ